MEKAGLVKGVREELDEALVFLKKSAIENGPDKLTRDNFAKNLAPHTLEKRHQSSMGLAFTEALPNGLSSSLTRTANPLPNGSISLNLIITRLWVGKAEANNANISQ